MGEQWRSDASAVVRIEVHTAAASAASKRRSREAFPILGDTMPAYLR